MGGFDTESGIWVSCPVGQKTLATAIANALENVGKMEGWFCYLCKDVAIIGRHQLEASSEAAIDRARRR
jgi:hypothetical protein